MIGHSALGKVWLATRTYIYGCVSFLAAMDLDGQVRVLIAVASALGCFLAGAGSALAAVNGALDRLARRSEARRRREAIAGKGAKEGRGGSRGR